jgi:hypothetical protein
MFFLNCCLTMETRSPVLCCWVTKYNNSVRLLVPYKLSKHQDGLISSSCDDLLFYIVELILMHLTIMLKKSWFACSKISIKFPRINKPSYMQCFQRNIDS